MFGVGPELPPTDFVELTETRVALTTATTAISFTATDGTHAFLGNLEAGNQRGALTLEGRILPTGTIWRGYTTTWGIRPFEMCFSYDIHHFDVWAFCETPNFVTIDEKVFLPRAPPSTVYRWLTGGAGGCWSNETTPPPNTVRAGAPVEACLFDKCDRYESGGSRLKTRAWRLGSTVMPSRRPHELFDTVVGRRCSPRRAADGVLRCLPMTDEVVWDDGRGYQGSGWNVFADPDCTLRLDPSDPAQKPYVGVQGENGLHLYDRGPISPLAPYRFFNGQCEAMSVPSPDAGVAFGPFTVRGAEIPPTTFASVSYVVQ